jgi:hypothetical protein
MRFSLIFSLITIVKTFDVYQLNNCDLITCPKPINDCYIIGKCVNGICSNQIMKENDATCNNVPKDMQRLRQEVGKCIDGVCVSNFNLQTINLSNQTNQTYQPISVNQPTLLNDQINSISNISLTNIIIITVIGGIVLLILIIIIIIKDKIKEKCTICIK